MADFNPDEFIQAHSGPAPVAAPTAPSVGVDQTQLQQFDPDDFIKQGQIAQAADLQTKYGSTPQSVLAGIEATARGATLGGSDWLETATGASTPEAIKGRMAANPSLAFLGNMAGSTGLILATGGLGGIAEAGVAGAAATGALFGAGNVISDAALGDPNLNAQKVLAEIGMGAAFGGGLGVLSKSIGALPALIRKGAKAKVEVAPTGEQVPVVDVVGGKKPTSLDEMQGILDQAKKYGGQENLAELPQKSEALDAHTRLGHLQQFPVTDMQMNSLASQDARNEFKTMLDVPGKNGEILRNYQGAQKKELINILDNAIDKEVAPGYNPTTNAIEAGERAAQAFTDQIEKTRGELSPAFQAIKETPLNEMDHLPKVLDYLTNPENSPYANPKLANMFDTEASELGKVKPYSTSMGVDRATYSAVKQAIDALKEDPESFEQLFDIRKGLSQHVDVTKLGDAPKEISSAKAAMMDYIQDAVQSVNPDQKVRDVFKKWAINEQNAQMIEKRFGAEIGSNNWRSLAKGGDEGILKKIFRDSDSVSAAKAILPKEDFNNLLADHLAIMRNDVTDKGVFSSNKFFSNFRRNQYALGEAFSENAPTFQKMKDSLTLMRIFADDAPQNPSGTTKTLLQALLSGGIDPFKHFGNLLEYGKGKFEEAVQAQKINSQLAGTADASKKLSTLQNMIKRADDKLSSSAKAIFSSSGPKGAALAAGAYLSDAEYDKLTKSLRGFYANPQTFMDDMASNSDHLYQAAPSITQGIHNTVAQAVAFLHSKLPQAPVTQMPLSPDWEPSPAQRATFNRYYKAVNNPIEVLKDIKNGKLSNETMEALQSVHPQFLQEARQKVMSVMKPEEAKKLAYSQKLSLSKFLGQPLDANMSPQGIASNQNALTAQTVANRQKEQRQRTPVSGMKKLNLSNRAGTITQQDRGEP